MQTERKIAAIEVLHEFVIENCISATTAAKTTIDEFPRRVSRSMREFPSPCSSVVPKLNCVWQVYKARENNVANYVSIASHRCCDSCPHGGVIIVTAHVTAAVRAVG